MRPAIANIILMLFTFLPTVTAGGPSVMVATDSDAYATGETIEVSLAADNDDEAMSVDAYVGLILPDGAIWCAQPDAWSMSIEPWISDVFVPAPFEMDRTPFWTLTVPSLIPPIESEGNYCFAAVLTHPGTFEWVSTVSFAQFTTGPLRNLDYYVDGENGADSNDGSEESTWRTITQALRTVIGSGTTSATIHVAAGKYAQSTNGETFPLSMRSWVSLVGEDAKTTIIDAEQTSRAIVCYHDDHLTIEGFTVIGGQTGSDDGGGILCSYSSPRIMGNIITQNRARNGGGIHCRDDSSPTIENNTISDNAAGSYSYDGGGGIYCDATSPADIRNNLIVGNSATLGGGIYYFEESPAIIENNTITGNSAKYGDGIYCYESLTERAYISPIRGLSEFDTNLKDINIRDCIIWGNGGWAWRAFDRDGLYIDLYCCSAIYSCIEQEERREGNIHADPLFVTGMFDDYYLDPRSPCVDTGSRSARQAGLSLWTTQTDGMPDLGTVDMGCHRRADVNEHRPTARIDFVTPNPVTQGEETVEFSGHAEDGSAGIWAVNKLLKYCMPSTSRSAPIRYPFW